MEVDVAQLARAGMLRRRPVHAALGGAVADEVLRRRDDARRAGRRPAGRARTRRPCARRGAGPRRTSPRVGPSAGRGRRRAPGRGPGARPSRASASRTASASASTSAGSHVLARPIACGKTVASRAIRPEQISSWTIAGMPSRVCSTRCRWIVVGERGRLGRPSGCSRPQMRVTWPSPWRSRAGAAPASRPSSSASWKTQRLPSCASLLLERHAAEQVVDALATAVPRRGRR